MTAPKRWNGPTRRCAGPRRCGGGGPGGPERFGDRGSGAAAVLVFALLFLALAAFVVDGGMSISQRERAADIAEQAARYAAQDIDVSALRDGGGAAPINYENCTARARTYMAEAGMSGPDVAASHCTDASDSRQVEVEVRLTYRPVLTGLFYQGDLTVHGTSKAESHAG
ncbi:pilus assembly protein TadG-related protein [Streptomyces sp. URMC 124]|uniref:pilus assembly protein TadG-related protein n=1 Tax=Streptomyces sp. URMC 124 TaxID=3423405 RepID=UPI003F19B245